jgi:hypothetical protein
MQQRFAVAIGGAALETEFIFYKSYAAKLLVSTYFSNHTKPLQPQGLFIDPDTSKSFQKHSQCLATFALEGNPNWLIPEKPQKDFI